MSNLDGGGTADHEGEGFSSEFKLDANSVIKGGDSIEEEEALIDR